MSPIEIPIQWYMTFFTHKQPFPSKIYITAPTWSTCFRDIWFLTYDHNLSKHSRDLCNKNYLNRQVSIDLTTLELIFSSSLSPFVKCQNSEARWFHTVQATIMRIYDAIQKPDLDLFEMFFKMFLRNLFLICLYSHFLDNLTIRLNSPLPHSIACPLGS